MLVDEAYIHLSDDFPNNTTSHLVAQGKDVLVARTFSKIFAMAGARLGFIMARPDLQKKLILYNNGGPNPVVSAPVMACGAASLTASAEIAKRRREMMDNRAMTIDFLGKRGLKVIPSHSELLFMSTGRQSRPRRCKLHSGLRAWASLGRAGQFGRPIRVLASGRSKTWKLSLTHSTKSDRPSS